MYNPYDYYFKKAKTQWYKARSAFKLEEIQNKFHLFSKKTKTIIDVWCAPGSRLQYAVGNLQKLGIKDFQIIWFDIKSVEINLPWVKTYKQDITDREKIFWILKENKIWKVDLIQSDMAPNTIGIKDIDAMRSFNLLEQIMRIFKEILKPDGKFVIKVFMWPWFEEYVREMKKIFGARNIKIFKPQSSRAESKEIYVIKI